MALTAMLIGAGIGVGKSALIDTPKEAADSKAKAEIMRWSPWTHLDPSLQKVHVADPFASAVSGAAMGQNYANSKGLSSDSSKGLLANGAGSAAAGSDPLQVGDLNAVYGYPTPTAKGPWTF